MWHLGYFKELKDGCKKWPVSHSRLHGFDQWQATGRSEQMCSANCNASQVQSAFMAIIEIHPYALLITVTSQIPSKVGPNPFLKETQISFGHLLKIT